MRLHFAGKTKGKLVYKPQQLKKGQKDTVPAVTLQVTTRVSNRILDCFDKTLRTLLFKKPSMPAKQGGIEGVEPLSDLSELTDVGLNLGTPHWNGKQTGCKLTIHQGATGDMNIVLDGGTVDKVQWKNEEGGGVALQFNFYASDLDHDTAGMLVVLHKKEVEFELELPELLQQSLDDKPAGKQLTPLGALKGEKAGGKAGAVAH